MSKIHAVLLVPEEGDPHGLLREGPCGARPPMAWQNAECRWFPLPHLSYDAALLGLEWQRALVLAWDGEPVVEGLDRLSRATGYEDHWRPDNLDELVWLAKTLRWGRGNLQ